MRPLVLSLLLVLPGLASASDVSGWTTFRCPNGRLVSLGATTYEVRTQCREPDDAVAFVEQRHVTRTVQRSNAKNGHRVASSRDEVETIEETLEIQVERWIYDFGRNRFVTKLRFENGRLVAITDGEKGVAEPQ